MCFSGGDSSIQMCNLCVYLLQKQLFAVSSVIRLLIKTQSASARVVQEDNLTVIPLK